MVCIVIGPATVGADEPAPEHRQFVFPDDVGVIDVTQPPYNAPSDGKADATAAIQKAIDDHPSSNRIIYLPHGTYLISDTLRWADGPHGGVAQKRIILQGQSTAGSIIRIADHAPGFDNPEKPKALIWTGRKPAQRFRNGLRNLTLDVGRGNPGAIGLQYIANNQGSIRDLHIISRDGAGRIGLDLGYTDEQGPCLVKRIKVTGFDIGVSMKHVVDSVVIEFLELEGQTEAALVNEGQCVSIRGLRTRGSVPAVRNLGLNSVMTIIDSDLAADRPLDRPAIENTGYLFARDVRTSGFGPAIESQPGKTDRITHPAGRIDQFVSHEVARLFDTAPRALNLPIEETPEPADVPLSQWAGPHQFGGKADDDVDDTAAVQKAIDSGARVLYFPYGKWVIDGDVQVRGKIERVTALEHRLAGKGTFHIVAGDAPVVIFDRIDFIYQHIGIHHAAPRTLVLSGITGGHGAYRFEPGAGDVFIEDFCGPTLDFHGQNVWARQLNLEARDHTKMFNRGGTLWVLGYKTENAGTLLETYGGQSEIVGGFCYAQGNPKTTPMFVVEDGAFSVTIGETTWNGRNFKTVVRQTNGSVTKDLGKINWRSGNASAVPLFVARPGE